MLLVVSTRRHPAHCQPVSVLHSWEIKLCGHITAPHRDSCSSIYSYIVRVTSRRLHTSASNEHRDIGRQGGMFFADMVVHVLGQEPTDIFFRAAFILYQVPGMVSYHTVLCSGVFTSNVPSCTEIARRPHDRSVPW